MPSKVIRLSRLGWLRELKEQDLPQEIVELLRGLVNTHMKSTMAPGITPRLIALAKEYLSKGVWIDDNEFYDVMVYIPENAMRFRSFFILVRKWPGGELKRLSEL